MALSDVLAELYADEHSARRVAKAAGVDVTRIAFTGTAANTWAALVDEAVRQQRLDKVAALALSEYPRHEPLLDYLLSNTIPPPPPPPRSDGLMTMNSSYNNNISGNESEAVVIARLSVQLEHLTTEVSRVSAGLSALRGLDVRRLEQGLSDIAYMRARIQTLSWVVAGMVAMITALSLAFLLHI